MKTGKRAIFARRLTVLLSSTAIVLAPFGALADDILPTGGQVVAGSVTVGTAGSAMTVTQGSTRAIVNWNGFSIGQGNSVTFVQPDSSSVILNRVTGNTTSTIAGALTGNGQVYLVNPNGIAITSTGSVKVGGGFVASTLDISNEDFLKGRYRFSGDGSSAGVSNAGVVAVGRGGYAALIGGTVRNDGLIAVPMGKVGLGSGEQATLDLSGDGFLQVALPTQAGAEGDGALIENGGRISAEGGTVVMRAATARNAARHAINLSGVVEADSVSGRDGAIVIGGGEGGKVAVSGRLSARSSTGKGGKVTVTGKSIALKGATVDASGATGGGTVRIGGDYQGRGNMQRAETTSIDAESTIKADATQGGDGGSVVVWSDDLTTFSGLITAMGAGTGKGGDAEVSGKALLAYDGFANLSGPAGFGTLLLDPYNIIISSGTSRNLSGFNASGNDSVLNVTTLTNALAGANVAVTTGSGGSQTGDIVVNSAISWSANTVLTLSAANNIAINANITATGANAGLVLNYGNYASAGTATSGTDYSVARGASVTLSGANSSLAINGTSYTLIRSQADLEAVNNALGGNYALAGNLDLAGTTYTGSVIGQSSVNGFFGSFAGLGHTISNLSISSTQNQIGLFHFTLGSSVLRDFVLVNGSVSGGDTVGMLVGMSTGRISNVGIRGGSVSALRVVGGLVGLNLGRIDNSYASAAVSGAADYVGGLAGYTEGEINNSHATGTVSGSSVVGGLAGYGYFISSSYATGAVSSAGDYVGGLVGIGGSISNSYATGAVSGAANYTGGLVGEQWGLISNSYATGAVSGSGSTVGGLVGAVTTYSGVDTTITASFYDIMTTGQTRGVGSGSDAGVTGLSMMQARSASSYTGWDFSNVWYQADYMRPILRSEAAPAIGGVIAVSNLNQLALIGANLSASYVLTQDIDASATSGSEADIWGQRGFASIGTDSSAFTGSFSGAGHTISNLTINGSFYGGGDNVGLFGVNSGTIRDIGLLDGSISGAFNVGSLVGVNHGTIDNAYSANTVSGSAQVGGLVGNNDGTVRNSYATGAVSSNNTYVGGLVGYSAGTIDNSYATGAVSGVLRVGGLVGFDAGTISNSHATGTVSGSLENVGGLVGYGAGTISHSYATGTVTGFNVVGGLVGHSAGTISNSYATGSVSGSGDYVGGLAGFNLDRISNAFATGSVTASRGNVGGLVGMNWGTIANAYATGDVAGSTSNVGGLVGSNDYGTISNVYASGAVTGSDNNVGGLAGSNTGTITASFFNTETTGQSQGVGGSSSATGVTGLTSAQMTSLSSYSGWSIDDQGGTSSVWRIYDGYTAPLLRSFLTSITVTGGDGSGTYNGLGTSSNVGDLTYSVSGYDPSNILGTAVYTASSANVGTYGGPDLTLSGLYSGQLGYDISFSSGTLTIDRAALTVTVNGATTTYDGLAYAGGNGVSYLGFVNGETASVLGGTLVYGGTAQGAMNAGRYRLTASGLSSGNYDITYTAGTLTVTPRAITVTADSASRIYGDSTSLSYTITNGSLIDGDSLTGSLASAGAASSANVGVYGITQGTLAASSNYALTYVGADLTVTAATLTIRAGNGSMVYGGRLPGIGYSVSGWRNGQGDSLLSGVSVATDANSGSGVGLYATRASGGTLSGAAAGNYQLAYVEGTFEVLAAQPQSWQPGYVSSGPRLRAPIATSGTDGDLSVEDPQLASALCMLGPTLSIACN